MKQRMFALAIAAAFLLNTAEAADRLVLGPAPGWVQPAPQELSAAPGTAAAVAMLLNDQQVRFAADAVETYVDNRIRIQTPQGLQAVGTIALSWLPEADVITVHRLVVRRGTQVRDLLGKPDAFTVLRREDMLEQATLTGALTAVLQPSDLQVGDTIEFAYTRRHADPVVPDKPGIEFAWPNAPIQNVRFRALWPKQMGMRWQLRDFKPMLEESSNGDTQSIAFTLENPTPLLQPTGAPARFAALRRLEISSFQSWGEVSRRFAPLYEKASRIAADSPLRAEIERIRKASTDPGKRAAAALQMVQEQVRYVLLTMNEGALVPAGADETWQRRYGDCKAKTALLLALLRELGVDAQAVTVNTAMGDGIDRLLPAISAFDHVLVRAQIAGKTYWLDGTRLGDRQLDRLQIPAFHWGLPLDSRGSELVRIEPAALTEPMMLQEVTIDASGGVDAPAPFQGKAVFRGDSALGMKLSMDNLDANQRDQGLRKFWRNAFDDLQVTKVGNSFDEANGTLTWTVEGTWPMDWTDDGFHEVSDMRPGYDPDFTRPDGTDTEAPYLVGFPDYSAYRVNVKLPAGQKGFSISGENIDETLAGWKYKRTATIENTVFKAEYSFRSVVPEISAKEAHAAESALKKLTDKALYIVKPRQLPSAAELRAQAGKPLETAGDYVDRGFDMTRRSLDELAIAEFTSALALEPGNIYAWANRGLSHLALKHYDAARVDFEKALKLDPNGAVAQRGLGALELEEGRTDEAIHLLTRSLKTEESTWARERRARAYLANKDVEHAAQDLVAISRAEPARTSHFESTALDLLFRNKLDEIRKLAKAALDAKAGPSNGALIAAHLYTSTGDIDRVRSIVADAISKTPSADIYTVAAGLESDPEKIIATLKQALELDPKSLGALNALAVTQKTAGKYSDALATIERLEAARGASSAEHVMRAEVYALAGDTEKARQSYAAVRALSKSSMALNSLCWQQAEKNFGLEDALKDCEAALAMEPGCVACLDSLGFVLLRMQRYEEAIAAYDKSIALEKREVEALFARGVAKLRLGRKDEGEADIATALRIEPRVEQAFARIGVKR